MITQFARVVLRGLLGLGVGILAGALICGVGFAVLVLMTGGNNSFGLSFSAFTGAILGSLYGAIVGSIVGLAGLSPARGGLVGLAIGAVIAAYIFFSASDPSLDSALLWIFMTGGILGSTTGFLSKRILKRITWST